DLAGGSVDITAAANTEKFVTFTNETNLGSVRICKNAGTGINQGDSFRLDVTGGTQEPINVVVEAGQCSTVNGIVDGTNVHVAEELLSSFRVVSIACNPGCTSINLAGASVDITTARGVEKSVTFTNETNLGSVRICKNAGTGINQGDSF